jgi:squalene-hopene/tetraprenyl-beta-curcumene cyclase
VVNGKWVATDRLRAAYQKVRDELLAERTADGHWVGELSSSALATATAISALRMVRSRNTAGSSTQYSALSTRYGDAAAQIDDLTQRGLAWLVKQQNADGGFGDTDLSHSNIATTYLVIAALHLAGVASEHAELISRAKAYIDAKGRLNGLRERYGIDKTFVVPIMTNLALAGLVEWREIDALPFELACVPQSWYRFVGMPVVSYAIPALVAIGQARFHHAPPRNPIPRLIRRLSISRSLKVLRHMQPDSGGYLEATPLTSFVVMSLASIEVQGSRFKVQSPHAEEVIREGVKFLINSARPDGSWPIDTNLATWNTTLSINALAGAGEDMSAICEIDDNAVLRATDTYMNGTRKEAAKQPESNVLLWLNSCQHLQWHPFTGACPGAFGWSDLTGSVPDADDTPGAMLAFGALVQLDMRVPEVRNLIGNLLLHHALGWLLSLQNNDGGWPTFCRGWGKLPFDRSGTDLTAHSLRALAITSQRFSTNGDAFIANAVSKNLASVLPRAMEYLRTHQHSDGSWSPLWFGNQDQPSEENPVYGTAKVLMAYRDLGLMDAPEAKRGVEWLVANQNHDGGWGSGVWGRVRDTDLGLRNGGGESLGEPVPSTQYSVPSTSSNQPAEIPNPKSQIPNLKSSIEETALALEALLAACPPNPDPRALSPAAQAASRGLSWLLDRVESGQHRQPAPIGFYFAKLWYYERLYPLIFTVAALGRACRQFAPPADNNGTYSSPAATSDFRAS